MEARVDRLCCATLLVAISLVGSVSAAGVRTQNFIVTAPTPQLAREIAEAAEKYRRDLALEWLEHELPPWSAPCPIVAHVDAKLGAGGRTSFMFRNHQPFGWEMEIQGSHERVLDSVLPHEITHTIFATHFGQPLPRWADEGACTTVEHQHERQKQEDWLIKFLRTERGIPFNHMFAMTEYPGDILPLYSQGFSLARFLIAQGGKRKFVDFVGAGLQHGNWPAAVREFYRYESLGELQLTWIEWVKQGSQTELVASFQPKAVQLASHEQPAPPTQRLASTGATAAPVANRTQPIVAQPDRPLIDGESQFGPIAMTPREELSRSSSSKVSEARSWYARRQPTEPLKRR